MSKEIIEIQNDKSDNPTGWESVAEMAEDGAGKGMESLADEPSFGEHMARQERGKIAGFLGEMREKLSSTVREEMTRRQVERVRGLSGRPGGAAKIARLIRSGKIDFSQEQVRGAYIDTVISDASNYSVDTLIRMGMTIDEIAGNERMRGLTAGAFKEVVEDVIKRRGGDATEEELYDGYGDNLSSFDMLRVGGNGLSHNYSSDHPPTLGNMGYSMKLLEKIAENEEGVKQLTEGLDIQQFGDILIKRTLKGLANYNWGEDEYNYSNRTSDEGIEEQIEEHRSRLMLLRKLGYKLKFGDGGMDLESLFDCGLDVEAIFRAQRNAQTIGIIDEKAVNEMCDHEKNRLFEYAKNPDGYGGRPLILIDDSLIANSDNKFFQKMKEYSTEFGGDAVGFIIDQVHDVYMEDLKHTKENGEEMYDFSKLLSEDGELGQRFFESTLIMRRAFEQEGGFEIGEVIRKLYARNIEKLSEVDGLHHIVGAIKTWDKIRDKNGDADIDMRKNFMDFVSNEYHDADQVPYYGDDDRWEKMFDESGPTKRFYEKILLNSKCGGNLIECIDEKWREQYTPAEVSYMEFKDHEMYEKLVMTSGFFYGGVESINNLFDEEGPNENFVNKCVAMAPFILADYPEIFLKTPNGAKSLAEKLFSMGGEGRRKLGSHSEIKVFMSEEEQKYLEFLTNPKSGDSKIIEELSNEDIRKYFDGNGPKPEFYQFLFGNGEFDVLNAYSDDLDDDVLDEKQRHVIKTFGEVDNRLRDVYKEIFKGGCEDYSIEGIDAVDGLLRQLAVSNADEIVKHPVEFARALLVGAEGGGAKELMDKYEKIEEIFVHNNLPYVGKVFSTYNIVFTDKALEKWRPGVTKRGDLGRVPENSRRGILWNDLLKAAIGSNDKSLREYLDSLKEGSALAERLLSEDVPESEFSDDEIGILNEYAEHLDTLYSNTKRGRQEQELEAMSVFDKVRYYSLKFSAEERRQVPDIIVRNFASGLGFKTLDELTEYMDKVVEDANDRNREAALRGEFKLESGDLIKSVDVEFLGNLLQGGVVCKEFLNGEMPSDSTPLDADLGVMPVGVSGSISEMVEHKNETNAFGAMHCMLVMKGDDNEGGRGRFKFEHEMGGYDPWKYEVWENGGENHGVRVGFPSTEIDYIVYDRINGDMYGDLERMKFEMVRSGLYIPVVDRYTEEVVFAPDDYDKMREERMGGLEEYSEIPYKFADERGVVDGFSLPEYRIGETVIPSTTELVEGAARNREEVDEKRGAIIRQVMMPVLTEFGLTYEDEISSNLFKGRAEVIDTGSTGRYSNAPHDGDFDFMMKLDKEIKDGARLGEIREALLDRMNLTPEQRAHAVQNGNIRATDVKIEGLDELVDIDVTFARRTAKVDYSTDMALNEYYEAMREQSPEKAVEVVANVVYAKKLLKVNGVYKPSRRDSNQGGLGGVGIENWVIQNGGSFEAAARSFMRVADECGDNFDLFKEKYSVFDFGENHKTDAKAAHDNFVVGNMNAVGYGKMRVALKEFLDKLDSDRG